MLFVCLVALYFWPIATRAFTSAANSLVHILGEIDLYQGICATEIINITPMFSCRADQRFSDKRQLETYNAIRVMQSMYPSTKSPPLTSSFLIWVVKIANRKYLSVRLVTRSL